MLPSLVVAASLLVGVAASSEGASCSAPSPTAFSHDSALLTLARHDPPPSDLAVPIRGRNNLVYSYWDELPRHIRAPSSASFPLVADAGVSSPANATADDLDANSTTASPTIADYARAARLLLDDQLLSHGAVYLRGLPLDNALDFSAFIAALGWNAVKLGGGGTQRSDVAAGVRSASDEPPEQTIEPHGDMAHSVQHPTHIAFFCLEGPPPGVGGETVLTNMRGVHSDLHALGVPQTFAERGGVAYHKRLWSDAETNHTTYTWQKFFFTELMEDALAEVRKRDPDAVVHRHGPGVIDFQEVLPAVLAHPATAEPLWFNGVHTNHRSYYVEAAHVDTSDGPPMDTTYADGTPIPESTIAAVRGAVWSNSVAVRLQKGDLVVVDNYLASHGRMGWVPPAPRRVLLTHFVNGPTAEPKPPAGA